MEVNYPRTQQSYHLGGSAPLGVQVYNKEQEIKDGENCGLLTNISLGGKARVGFLKYGIQGSGQNIQV